WELPAVDQRFCGAVRVELAPDAWVDHVPGWVIGADALLETVVELVAWKSPMVRMWDKQVQTPRLSGALAEGERPAIVEEMRWAVRANGRGSTACPRSRVRSRGCPSRSATSTSTDTMRRAAAAGDVRRLRVLLGNVGRRRARRATLPRVQRRAARTAVGCDGV